MSTGEPADQPAAIQRWRQELAPELVATAWNQVLLRTSATEKFSRAERMLFDRVGLEQSTSEQVAIHKAARFNGLAHVVDMCCGIGGDALALAAGRKLTVVDRSAARSAMARHNAAVYGYEIEARTGDVAVDWPDADAVHIDPDRRATGRRSHDADSGSPGLVTLERIVAHYRHAAIKLSPGADFEQLAFPCEIELISVRGECKQAMAWTGDLQRAHRTATSLPSGESLSAAPGESLEWPQAQEPRPGVFLYEPDSAVIRANLVGLLARQCDLAPIDARIAWLTGHREITHGLLRSFRILDVMPWSTKSARAWLARHLIGRLEVKTRGFAGRPEAILKQLRLTGDRAGVLFLTRLGDKPTAILAERL